MRRKIQFFSRSPVDFGLHDVKLPLLNHAKISSFRETLLEKTVGVFDSAFLSGTERIGKIHRGAYMASHS